MATFELKVFQTKSANLIAERYAFFAKHRPSRADNRPRPFFQALSALTGAGKTPILASAVSLLRMHLVGEPIVLWMSTAKSVVGQTFNNFSGGGKYNDLIDEFRVINIQNLTPELISDGSAPLLVLTTIGLFNSKDQAAGALNIYKKDQDLFGDSSPWQRLIERKHGEKRRPLIIVYDEAHRLSPQQTEILSELEPDAYLLASATLKLPDKFQKSVIQPIKLWFEELNDLGPLKALKALDEAGKPEAERFVTTAIHSECVVKAQLVKKAIRFDGTTSTMERCLDDLFSRYASLKREISRLRLNFTPKAIYVCRTNITDAGDKDDPAKPFQLRQAPPIKIWRYLVEEKKVKTEDIAIYANLTFLEGNKPDEVNLYSQGENDFDEFSAGNYKHIIFNLALQEGWDDPACYLAYIDKSMGSSIQVEQIIGRVLRQFGATHYDSSPLNAAHFFLRVDSQAVFTEAIQKVKAKLQSEGASIEVNEYFAKGASVVEEVMPREDIDLPALHHIYVNSKAADERAAEILEDFPSFIEGDPNTLGEAQTGTHVVDLEQLDKEVRAGKWKSDGQTNPVRLRWLVGNAIKARSTRVYSAVVLEDKKFDVRVQIHSKADRLAQKVAAELVKAFFEKAELVYEKEDPFEFAAIHVAKTASCFQNAIYQRYSGLRKFELQFANALDDFRVVWHRNPSSGGFYIPLLSEGDTARFYPDFLAWKKGKVYALETKGGHLLSDAVARKLFDIPDETGKTKILTRFISEGKQQVLGGKALKGGYTIWLQKTSGVTAIHVDDLGKAVEECLR